MNEIDQHVRMRKTRNEITDLNLISDRLHLEEISWNDLEAIHKLHSCPEVDEFNTLGLPDSLDDTRKIIRPWIEARTIIPRSSYTWKILLKKTDLFVGLAGMHLSNDKFRLGEIYFKLLPEHWGMGYATETARLLIRTGFEVLHLHKVEAGVATGNTRSVKVLEKAGMKREGLRRKILPIRGEWVDNYHYAVVEDDEWHR
jgi:ribosomal-protein-alanine N-acetyltransferase